MTQIFIFSNQIRLFFGKWDGVMQPTCQIGERLRLEPANFFYGWERTGTDYRGNQYVRPRSAVSGNRCELLCGRSRRGDQKIFYRFCNLLRMGNDPGKVVGLE